MLYKTIDIKNSGITIIRYAQNLKIGKPTNLKVWEKNKTKGPKQDIQNRLRSPSIRTSAG
jgi:hypothetical protein